MHADAQRKTAAGSAWDDIARAEQRYREILIPYTWLEGGAAFNSELFGYARQLVRAADERAKPNTERLREYTDAGLARLKPALEAATPVYPAFERCGCRFRSSGCASIWVRIIRSSKPSLARSLRTRGPASS